MMLNDVWTWIHCKLVSSSECIKFLTFLCFMHISTSVVSGRNDLLNLPNKPWKQMILILARPWQLLKCTFCHELFHGCGIMAQWIASTCRIIVLQGPAYNFCNEQMVISQVDGCCYFSVILVPFWCHLDAIKSSTFVRQTASRECIFLRMHCLYM